MEIMMRKLIPLAWLACLLGVLAADPPSFTTNKLSLAQPPSRTSNVPLGNAVGFTNQPKTIYQGYGTNMAVFRRDGSNILEVAWDGRVTLHAPADEAARLFWVSVSRFASSNHTETLEVLKACRKELGKKSTEQPEISTTLEYRPLTTPAEQLRARAAAIEARDALIERLRKLLEELEKP